MSNEILEVQVAVFDGAEHVVIDDMFTPNLTADLDLLAAQIEADYEHSDQRSYTVKQDARMRRQMMR